MKLAEYLVSKGMKQADFARLMNVTQPAVHNWIYKKAPPSSRQMMKIYKWSGCRIGLKDWCEDFYDEHG